MIGTKKRIIIFITVIILSMFLCFYAFSKGYPLFRLIIAYLMVGILGYLWMFLGTKKERLQRSSITIEKDGDYGLVTLMVHESDVQKLGTKHKLNIDNISQNTSRTKNVVLKQENILFWKAEYSFLLDERDSYRVSVDGIGEAVLKQNMVKRIDKEKK